MRPGAATARSRAGRGARALAALLLAVLAGPDGAQAQPRPTVQAGVDVSADTVTIGSPFVVSVRVRAPLGDSLLFPAGPDTTGPVQALDPVSVRAVGDGAAVDRTAQYRLAAWDVGRHAIELGPVTVVGPDGSRELALPPATIVVRSVLPADSALRVPRPARALWEFPRPWWIPWLIGLLALALLLLIVWWLLRRRRRPGPARVTDPYAEAEERFAGVEALGLLEAGERGRYVALMLEVVRDYLARRIPAASPALTSRELLVALAPRREVPHDRLAAVLLEGDLVKFARRPVSAERARELGAESRAVVSAVEQAVRAGEAPPAPPAPPAPSRPGAVEHAA